MPHSDFEPDDAASEASTVPAATGRIRLLLAHADQQLRERYADVLQNAGYEVIGVAHQADALADLDRAHPAMIIAQLGTPMAESLAFYRKLRRDIETRDVPVIVLTRLDDAYTRDQIVRSGASAILMEPPQRALLLRQVRRLNARARAHATGSQRR